MTETAEQVTKIDDGGPFFPCPEKRIDHISEDDIVTSIDLGIQHGASSRQVYAGLANEADIYEFQEWFIPKLEIKPDQKPNGVCFVVPEPKYTRIEARYRFADAMIKQSKAPPA